MSLSYSTALLVVIYAFVLHCIYQSMDGTWKAPVFCKRNDPNCWPTPSQVENFHDILTKLENTALNKTVSWDDSAQPPQAPPDAIPLGSEGEQPMYGVAVSEKLPRLYVLNDREAAYTCFPNISSMFRPGGSPEYSCNLAARHNEFFGWNPAFIVSVTSEQQINATLQFAIKHKLCISVFGTGHEMLNRHSCPNGVLIKTILLKNKEYLAPNHPDYPNTPQGSLRLQPGLTFAETHKWIEGLGYEMASGWCTTVGIVGWSTGGGHGPFAGSMGLGVDNTLDFGVWQIREGPDKEPVPVKVWAREDPDLLTALHGGGGSSWGIIDTVVIKAHPKPPKISQVNLTATGTFCDNGTSSPGDWNHFTQMVEAAGKWFLKAPPEWGMQWFGAYGGVRFPGVFPGPRVAPELYKNETEPCKMPWAINIVLYYTNTNTTTGFKSYYDELEELVYAHSLKVYNYNAEYDTFFEASKNAGWPIEPVQQLPPGPDNVDSLPSVLVTKEHIADGLWAKMYLEHVRQCPDKKICEFVSIIYMLTGMNGADFPEKGTVISPGLRKGVLHYVSFAFGLPIPRRHQDFYVLGDYSYFSESAFVINKWQNRYWTAEDYSWLVQKKTEMDPFNHFWCHHCIGDQPDNEVGWKPDANDFQAENFQVNRKP